MHTRAQLSKWQALEELDNGMSHGLVFGNFSAMHTGAPVGPSWYMVFLPTWTSEAASAIISTAELFCGPPAGAMTRNLACLHLNSFAQSVLCGIFLLLLTWRLEAEGGSWSLVFVPWYVALATQATLHYHKTPDARGRTLPPRATRPPARPPCVAHARDLSPLHTTRARLLPPPPRAHQLCT